MESDHEQVCSAGREAGARNTRDTCSASRQSTIPPLSRSAIARLSPASRETPRRPIDVTKRHWVAASLIVVMILAIVAAMNGLRIVLVNAHAERTSWCVTVGKYDRTHEVIVCDNEAMERYNHAKR